MQKMGIRADTGSDVDYGAMAQKAVRDGRGDGGEPPALGQSLGLVRHAVLKTGFRKPLDELRQFTQ